MQRASKRTREKNARFTVRQRQRLLVLVFLVYSLSGSLIDPCNCDDLIVSVVRVQQNLIDLSSSYHTDPFLEALSLHFRAL